MQVLFQGFERILQLFEHHPMLTIGALLIFGYFLSRLVTKLKLPEITGFILAGLLLGHSAIGIVSHHMGESLAIVTETTLGLIALTIGGEFSRSKLKRLGKEVIIITMIQLLVTFCAVSLGLWIFKMELPFSLLLGAIASATAPAATVAIVQSLRARGLFIDYLYGIVALDDAGCVILFGLIFSFTSGFLRGGGAETSETFGIFLHAVKEVVLSIVIGILGGFFMHVLTTRITRKNEILIIAIGILFITTAISVVFHLSPMLSNMAAGATLINLSSRNFRIFGIIEPMTPPIYALFFVIAGTELNPQVFLNPKVLLFGSVYILFRAVGKYGGVYMGCSLARVSPPVRKYLGFCMLPQAGVAIGLVLLIETSPVVLLLDPAHKAVIGDMVNIVLLSVFINELFGPPISKYAIIKGNEMEE
ncbi:cation:proton antiporter [candidate division KSB1 bacterium]|nr:cation:proton antiporter [candidate division KSB1 bacterium]